MILKLKVSSMAPFAKRFDDVGRFLAIYAVAAGCRLHRFEDRLEHAGRPYQAACMFNNYEAACGFISGPFSSPAC
jgi:hypothetical protein